MFITKKHIPRRTFLRGAGVTLALPLLESMVPALTPLRLTAAAPVQALCRHLASAWRGAGILESAAGRQGLRVFVHHQAAGAVPRSRRCSSPASTCRRPWPPTTSRAATMRAARSCCPARGRDETPSVPYLGVTIDQTIAKKYGQDTILSSIQLGVEDTGNFGNCNWGYSCAYTNSISWSSPDAAAADGSESARGLRAPVRRRQRARRSG